MNTHIMGLNPGALKLMVNGIKTIEMRLYDEKREEISKGDNIIFIDSGDENNRLEVRVKELYRYDSFFDLYKKFDKIKLGYRENELAMPNDMEVFYSRENIDKYGVLGIEVEVIY